MGILEDIGGTIGRGAGRFVSGFLPFRKGGPVMLKAGGPVMLLRKKGGFVDMVKRKPKKAKGKKK